MAINTDFYGLQENWIDVQNARYELKKPAWTDSALSTNSFGTLDTLVRSHIYNPDNLATVPLDSTIVPWKINKNSKICNRHYCEVSFPNHVSGEATIQDYFGQNASYKESEKSAYKDVNGYRFFLAYTATLDNNSQYSQGAWTRRYSPYNYKNEFLNGTSGLDPYKTNLYPIIQFNYKKTVVSCGVRLIPKQYIDAPADPKAGNTTDNHYYNWHSGVGPDYSGVEKQLTDLTEQDLIDYYVVGFYFVIYSGGQRGTGSTPAGVGLSLLPFDPLNPVPADDWGVSFSSYYPYQRDYAIYTQWIASADPNTNRSYSICQIGGSTSQITVAECGEDGAEPATYMAQYTETRSMRTMNTDKLDGQGSTDLANITFMSNTGSGSPAINRVRAWFIPLTYNSLGVEGIKNAIHKEMAYLGFIFTDSHSLAKYVDIENNPNLYYIPEIDSNGVTTGNYKTYGQGSDYQNYNWNNDVYEQTPYNPYNDDSPESADPNTYDNNITILNTTVNTISQEFVTPYVLNDTILKNVATFLYDTINTDWNPDDYTWSGKALYVNNPMDVVISLMYFPFDVLTAPYVRTFTDDLLFGSLNSEIASPVLYSSYCILDFGKCTYYPNYGVKDFRNYEPYCKGELYIPYCGSVSINPAVFLDKTLSVKMIVDLRTGSCLALVYRDSMVMQTIRGQIGITIPISGIQAQTLASSEVVSKTIAQNADISETMNFIDMAGTFIEGATGNKSMLDIAGSYATSILSSEISTNIAEKAAFSVNHVNVPFKVIGTASPVTSLANERRCRFILKRPVMLTNDLSNFAHQNGFATLEHNTLNNYSGYTVCDSADLSGINCTKTEKNLIMNFLKNGVYL